MATPAKKAPAKSATPAKAPVRPTKPAAPEPEVEAGTTNVSATLSESKAKELGLDSAPSVTVQYNFGADLDDAVERFGGDVVFGMFKDAATIALQAKLRRAITASVVPNKAGQVTALPDDPQDLVGEWKPAVGGGPRKSASEKVASLVGKLSPEERAALIAKLSGEDDDE